MNEEQIVDTHEDAPSMDDTIRAALADIQTRDDEPDEVTIDAPEETEEETAARVRDEKGRFAAKQAEEVPADSTPEATEIADEAILPPEVQRLGLRKEEAAEWNKASPVLQQALLRRSEEMHKGLEQYRGAAQFGSKVADAFRPYEQTLQKLGVTPDVAIGKLLQADDVLRYGSPDQKAFAIQSLMNQYGVDMGQVNNLPHVDPQVMALQNQIQQMQGYFSNLQRTQAEREQETLNSEISQFSQGREHFEQVREDMAALLQAGRATNLSDAYEQAIWANPTTRAALLAKQQQEAAAKAESERKAQDARRAASVNVPRRGNIASSAPTGTMEDTIRATASKLGLI